MMFKIEKKKNGFVLFFHREKREIKGSVGRDYWVILCAPTMARKQVLYSWEIVFVSERERERRERGFS